MRFFKEEEFTCKCGCNTNKMNPQTLQKLDRARGISGVPYVINSGYRCEAHNRSVSRVENSSHTKGYAADIRALDGRSRYLILKGLIEAGFNRIGIARTFIHADDDPNLPRETIWEY